MVTFIALYLSAQPKQLAVSPVPAVVPFKAIESPHEVSKFRVTR